MRVCVSIKENQIRQLRKHRTETTGKQDKAAAFHTRVKKCEGEEERRLKLGYNSV